ncbi:serine/threonine protein kinase [Actinoplanes sp. NPDC004185]
MTGGAGPAGGRPLLPGDPRQLGRYELIGRLGEGGMGTVYLASTPEGRRVAIKIIKSDLADDPQFRQRFRTEVERAQDVPPFCTAEVLDADPDHAPPYLVVEYVAGPSLAAVVAEHGPLTSSNLHGLAIGVATALTGIHGAGVIHRDLKPSNVLLAPGSPKVIDFGIARAVEGAVNHTRTDQMVGTVTYMAPERFDSSTGRNLTPAADIFAWGAVIAYAGTGRTPFAADMPHMVAVRILTMPPDLEGLTGPLRDLVEQALAKDPADRPTARELLDRLLDTGPSRAGGAAAVLERQPALREAVADARAADDVQARERTAAMQLPSPGEAGSPTTRFNLQGRAAAEEAPARAEPTVVIAPPVVPEPAAAPRRRFRGAATAVLAGTAVIAVTLLVGIVTGLIPVNRGNDENPQATGPSATPSVSAARPSVAPDGDTVIADPLTSERDWRVVQDPANKASCEFDGALVVEKRSAGPYRCPGPRRLLTDFTATVTAKLLTKGACAAVWLRFDKVDATANREAGYVLAICADGYTLMTHGATGVSDTAELASFPFAEPVGLREPIAVAITADGPKLSFSRDGTEVGSWKDSQFPSGRVVFGMLNKSTGSSPAQVSFNDVEIRA